MTNELLTMTEVASMLKVTKRTIGEMCRERTRQAQPNPIPVIRLNKKLVRFSRTAVERWIEEKQVAR